MNGKSIVVGYTIQSVGIEFIDIPRTTALSVTEGDA